MTLSLTEILKGYRVVDLSEKVVQGASSGTTGEQRWYYLRMFPFPPGQVGGEWMHIIAMESHIGTHVEAPSHWLDAAANREGTGKDVSEIPLSSYYGEAILIRCDGYPDGYAVKPQDLAKEGVK